MNYIRRLNNQNISFIFKLFVNVVNYILQKKNDFVSFLKNN